mgnify:CR=1 FL=1
MAMGFNISDILNNKRSSVTPEIVILNILQRYESNMTLSQVDFHNGILYLKGVSPHQKTHTLLKKLDIMAQARREGVIIRDIM